MGSENIELAFRDFVDSISLTKTDLERMEAAYRGLTGYLENNLTGGDDVKPEFYRQGSFENQTVVVPLNDGEYDIDIIIEFDDWPEDAGKALDLLADTIESNKTYSDKTVSKKSCVRVEYADSYTGKFHVDLVPAKGTGEGTRISVARRGGEWKVSDPKAYTAWCKEKGTKYQEIVKIFKRWRDENETVKSSIKSIQLQVLLAEAISEAPMNLRLPDLVRYAFVKLEEIMDEFSDNSPLLNPVLPEENLAESWPTTSRKHFRESLASAVEEINSVEEWEEEEEQFDLWMSLLGDDFPELASFEVEGKASTSHRIEPARQGWRVKSGVDRRLTLDVAVETYRKNTRALKPNEQRALKPGRKVKFALDDSSIPAEAKVWWQVTNTGKHARLEDQLRGDFILAKGRKSGSLSKNQSEHWEQTAYHGTHIVQAFVIVNDEVWGRSNEIEIRVASSAFWRRLSLK